MLCVISFALAKITKNTTEKPIFINMLHSNQRNRRSIRLPRYDYSLAGAYFVTICTADKACLFGNIRNGKMVLNALGKVVEEEWFTLEKRYPRFVPDMFQIMPNHIHAIVIINDVGAGLAPARPHNVRTTDNINIRAPARDAPTTLGQIVGAYKSLVYKQCLAIAKSKNEILGKLWQRNYHEHIVRNAEDYQRIAQYIHDNPVNWAQDDLFQ